MDGPGINFTQKVHSSERCVELRSVSRLQTLQTKTDPPFKLKNDWKARQNIKKTAWVPLISTFNKTKHAAVHLKGWPSGSWWPLVPNPMTWSRLEKSRKFWREENGFPSLWSAPSMSTWSWSNVSPSAKLSLIERTGMPEGNAIITCVCGQRWSRIDWSREFMSAGRLDDWSRVQAEVQGFGERIYCNGQRSSSLCCDSGVWVCVFPQLLLCVTRLCGFSASLWFWSVDKCLFPSTERGADEHVQPGGQPVLPDASRGGRQ